MLNGSQSSGCQKQNCIFVHLFFNPFLTFESQSDNSVFVTGGPKDAAVVADLSDTTFNSPDGDITYVHCSVCEHEGMSHYVV